MYRLQNFIYLLVFYFIFIWLRNIWLTLVVSFTILLLQRINDLLLETELYKWTN